MGTIKAPNVYTLQQLTLQVGSKDFRQADTGTS
jgi:hypothetical protein